MTRARSRDLLDHAIAAMVAAIDVYNKPDFRYRSESFTILALNAWELLLKAKWLALHGNRLNSLYAREASIRKRHRYKRTSSGGYCTHGFVWLSKQLAEKKILDAACLENLNLLAEQRNLAVHFYHRSPEFAERIQQIGMAAVRNFFIAVKDWFEVDLSTMNFYMMPLSFVPAPSVNQNVILTKDEKRFLEYLFEKIKASQDQNLGRYSIAIQMEVRFDCSRKPVTPAVCVSDDQGATKVYLEEQEIRTLYPWDYEELTRQCRERYCDFKVNSRYHALRRELEKNSKYARERRLDPNKDRPKKTFYSPAILNAFDKQYKCRGCS